MKFISYEDKYKNQVIALILYLQNFDNRVDLSLDDQPDLNDIYSSYIKPGGGFWLALDDNGDVAGTIALMKKEPIYGVLKKFFVLEPYRGRERGVSSKLFEILIEHAHKTGIKQLVLDTPAACKRAHSFYKREGFEIITRDQLPVQYHFAERDCVFMSKKI